jgi:hypothetical protein
VQRQLVWAGTDAWRAESALVAAGEGRFAATGVQLGVLPVPYRLDYRLEAGPAWVTRLLDVTAVGRGWRRSARLTRDDAGQWTYRAVALGESDLPEPVCDPGSFEGALDCDLGLSPLTNTMPMLRQGLHESPGAVDLTMAWMSVPDLAVAASAQRYDYVGTTAAGSAVRFSSGSFVADLTVDGDGFVIDYPGLARRVAGDGPPGAP